MNSSIAASKCLLALGIILYPMALRAVPQPHFKVGVITPLSGPVAPMGDAFRKGFELYERDNPACKEKASLIFEDGRYDGKVTSLAFQKLTSVDRVNLTVVWGNTPASVCAPMAETNKAPLLAVAYTPEAKNRSYVMTFGPKTKMLSRKIAEEFKTWKLQKPAAITVNIGNTLEEIGYVKDILGGKLDVRVVATEETDFRSILTQLRGKGVDGLLAFVLPDQAMSLARQAAELNYTPPMIGADIFADLSFGSRVSALLPRLAYVYSSVDPQFVDRSKKDLGSSSYFFEVASGYTLGELACRLGAKAGPDRDLDVLAHVKGMNFQTSPIGGLTYAEDGEYGAHFENDANIYYLTGGPTP